MKQLFFLLFALYLLTTNGFAQNKNSQTYPIKIYSDFVADESGNRLHGITVKVLGGDSDITDMNGEFSVKAKIGDKITLYRDGKKMNSYIYDGSLQYEIEDQSEKLNTRSIKKESLKRKKKSKKFSNASKYQIALDSANFYVKKNPTKSIQFVEEALNATNNKKKTAQAYETLGDAFFRLKQYDLAQSNYVTASLKLSKSIPLQLKLANAYFNTSNFTKSNQLYTKIVTNNNAVPFQKIMAYDGIANIYKAQKKYNKSIFNYEKGLLIAKNNSIIPKITDLSAKIAEVLNLQGNRDKSQTYILNSIKSAKNESKNRAIVQSNKAADFYGRNNNIKEEIKLRKETLKDLEDNEINEIESTDDVIITKQKVKYDIANALEKQQNYPEAIQYFKASAVEAENRSDIETEKKAIQGLSEVYAKIGDDNNALIHYKKYTKLVDLIYQQKESEIAKAVAFGKDLIAKQSRISSLEKDRELTKSKLNLFKTEQTLVEENNRRQKLIIYSLIGGLLLLLLSLFYMFRSNKQRKLSNNLLALKSLRSQMNPHFIFNALNSVNSFIASNDERTANRYLTDFSTLMRSVLENSEQDFIPLEKEIELLDLYLKLEHTRFEDKFDFVFNIADNVRINDFQIPPMLLQPYIENAVWHGLRYKKEKGLLQIDIEQSTSDILKISISDNGIGRKQSKALKSKNQLKQKSKGMQNIKQRVAILNEMYHDKVEVSIGNLFEDETGTKVVLFLKKD